MTAELIAHDREDLVRDGGFFPRAKPPDERVGYDRRRHVEVDRFKDRPPTFARVGHEGRDVIEAGETLDPCRTDLFKLAR